MLVWDCCEVVYENLKRVWNIDKDVIRSCHKFFWKCMDVFVKYFIDLELDVGELGKKSLMPSVLLHILVPFSGYVCTSILHGMIPAAYFSLRQIIEALTIVVYLDVCGKYKDLKYEEKFRKAQELRISTILNEFKDIDEELASRLKELYDLLSSYMHPFAKKGLGGLVGLADQMISRLGGPPTFLAVPLPSEYLGEELDREEFNRLKTVVHATSDVVLGLMNTWYKHVVGQV